MSQQQQGMKLKEVEIITNRKEENHQSIQLSDDQDKDHAKVQQTLGDEGQASLLKSKPMAKGESSKEKKDKKGKYKNISQDQGQTEEEKKDMQALFDGDEIKSPHPKLEAFLDNNYFQIFVTLMTIYALFGDDMRVIATTKSADIYFDVITISSMAVFLLEMLLGMLSKISYTCSFYFWLDLISTISLVLDIQLITQQIFYSTSGSSKQLAQAGKASRVGTKAGRVVRLVRLIRIVKLYKATQDAKEKRQNIQKQKYAMIKKKKQNMKIHPNQKEEVEEKVEEPKKSTFPCFNKKKKDLKKVDPMPEIKETKKGGGGGGGAGGEERRASLNNNNHAHKTRNSTPHQIVISGTADQTNQVIIQKKAEEKQQKKQVATKESRVSQVLSARTTKRVIIIVLAMLFIIPLFSSEYFFDPPSAIDFSMNLMQEWAQNPQVEFENIETLFNTILATHEKGQTRSFIAKVQTPLEGIQYEMDDYAELREDEKSSGHHTLNLTEFCEARTDPNGLFMTKFLYRGADGSKCSTGGVEEDLDFSGVLSNRETAIFTSALSLGRTVFVCFVLTCGALYFSKDANDLALGPIERMIEKLTLISQNPISAKDELEFSDNSEEYETKQIENAIGKISNLLALGFGDAGSKIIGANISKQGGDIDPMIAGHKLCAIYGFCDIRNFTDTTEVLQEEIMIFVNNIGEIVHSYTDRYQGAGNKNIGDAFLLVWTIMDEKYQIQEDNTVKFLDQKYISILCDMAVLCFMRINSKLNRELKIIQYRQHKGLNERMPNYRVKMGFGLHLGWAIEGAIGSEFKIDASYLSPNVNLAERLEGATKQYGVPMIISNSIQEQCTLQLKRYTRYIDRVSVAGSNKPIGLYTIDMDTESIPPSKDPNSYSPEEMEERKEFYLQLKKQQLTATLQYWIEDDLCEDWDAESYINERKDLKLIMETWDEAFQNLFAEGFQQYIAGNWKAAKSKFLYIQRSEFAGDGPTQALLNYMSEFEYKSPPDWPGYRPFQN